MGVCINCLYHIENGSQEVIKRRSCGKISMKSKSGHYCVNDNNKIVDFVTGAEETPDCYDLNRFEECIFFVDKSAPSDEDIPYEEEKEEVVEDIDDTESGDVEPDDKIETGDEENQEP